jgi:hypothetical protein
MSVDVAAGSYFFTPLEQNPDVGPDVEPMEDLETFRNFKSHNVSLPRSDNKPSFRYGMLHDLESLLWIAIWFLFRTHPQNVKPGPGQVESAEALFSRESDVSERQLTLRNCSRWAHHIQHIPVEYFPMAHNLNKLRTAYINMAELTYLKELKDREATVAFAIHTGHDVTAYHIFRQCFVNSGSILITSFKAPTTALVVSVKRKAGDFQGAIDSPGEHDEAEAEGNVKRPRSLRLQNRKVGSAH